jgi:sugar phosphate isomerase/epimerase
MDLSAIIGTLEAGGYSGWYDMEIFSGEHYPDSLMEARRRRRWSARP